MQVSDAQRYAGIVGSGPSEHDSQIIEASIREFGVRQPIVVDEAGVILVGHTRRDAAALLESGPTAEQVLTGEVDAEQAAAAAAEVAKFPKG